MKRRGSHYFSLIPSSGSRIALHMDKQLELAHAKIYCRSYNTPNADAPLRTFMCFDLRDLTTEDNVPLNVLIINMFSLASPQRATRVICKGIKKSLTTQIILQQISYFLQ